MLAEAKARYKIVLVGESEVGKTSLIRRYVDHSYDEKYVRTLGALVSKHTDMVTLDHGRSMEIALLIWDIMGKSGLMKLVKGAYFLNAQGALAVFDVTRLETLQRLREWIVAAHHERPEMPMVILGNKVDLEDRRQVTDEEALNFAEALGLPYLATSAKTGLNVEAAFRHLAREALRVFASLH